MRYFVLKQAAVAFFVAGLFSSLVQAEFAINRDFEVDQTVETITVRLTVDADGDDLEEPVALDLGLGFPFWLHPAGREASDPVPFGAIPQESTASAKVPAGSTAAFTFRLEGDSGQDDLLTAPQLLAGVRVSDIARIGFVSRGMTDWKLAAFEIEINGKAFASNDKVNLKVRDAQDEARLDLADLGVKTGPISDELSDLHALIKAELASDTDKQRAATLASELATLRTRVRWIEGQVAGKYPWFEEPGFRSPWRKKSSITEATAIVVTNTDPGADTKNYVYFSTGGKKYALNPLTQPLEGRLGSQKFALDLLSGPLTAADLRGCGVGMLAHRSPYGDAPDRWHPKRILMELDGRLVYDSDESPIDRNSLEAISVIPPAHFNAQSELVANTPNLRETCLWEAGKGAGLNLEGGGALPLPPPDDPAYPPAEPGDPGNGNLVEGGGGSGSGGGPGSGGNGPGLGGGPDWLNWLLGWLLNNLPPLPPGVDPPTGGSTFGIDSVAITKGWKYEDEFTVEWTTSGDENEIDHYEVYLVHVQPDKPIPFKMESPLLLGNVPRGGRGVTAPLPTILVGTTSLEFAAPVVVGIPTDPKNNPYWRPGPARPVFPVGTKPLGQPELCSKYVYSQMGKPLSNDAVKLGFPESSTGRAVWVPGQIESHNAILFDDPKPAMHVVMRPGPGDNVMAIELKKRPCRGRNRVAAYVGFLGGGGGDSEVEVAMTCLLIGKGAKKLYAPKIVTVKKEAGGSPAPLTIIEQVIDSADLNTKFKTYPNRLRIVLRFQMKKVDPAHPPAVFGLGMIPVK